VTAETRTRVLWGVAFAVLVIATVLWAGADITFFVAMLLGLQGWKEYARMMGLTERPSLHYLGFLFVVVTFTLGHFVQPPTLIWVWFVWLCGFIVLFLETSPVFSKWNQIHSASHFDPAREWSSLIRFVIGLIYIYMIFGYVGPVAAKAQGEQVLLMAFIVVFCGDSAAYFVGKAKGRHKLWPALSPNKTIEGALGGFAGSLICALVAWGVYQFGFREPLPLWKCLALGLMAPFLGQLADFLESLAKRAAGRKDSGGMIPGHGGILDRADGLAFVMPLVYFLF
jgi:phosphatidate cytidylyltransferase